MANDEYDDEVYDDDEEVYDGDEDDDEDLDLGEDLDIDVAAEDEDDVDEGEEEEDEEEESLEEELEEEDEDEDEEESLDILLTRGVEDDLVRLDDERADTLSTAVATIAADEFTCRSCFLVKRQAQLADAEQMICFDCA